MFRLSSLTLFGYGCVCEPQKICHRFRGRPQIDNKDCTGGYDKRLRGRNSLGLHGFHGCGYAAVDEGQVIISAIRIRTHTQTERIYDIYYRFSIKVSFQFFLLYVLSKEVLHDNEQAETLTLFFR